MPFYPLMRGTLHCWTPGSLPEVRQRLEKAFRSSDFTGRVHEDDRFELVHHVPNVRNSWRPQVTGTLTPAGDGVRIELTGTVNWFVFLFTAGHGVFLLGITWLVGAGAFSWEMGKVREAVHRALGEGTLWGEDMAKAQSLSDPTAAGAELGAPWSLRARVEVDEVRFELRADEGILGSPVLLDVDAGGLQIRQGRTSARIPWDQLLTVAHVNKPSRLGVVDRDGNSWEIGTGSHPERDLDWLVQYLNSKRIDDPEGLEARRQARARAARLGAREPERG